MVSYNLWLAPIISFSHQTHERTSTDRNAAIIFKALSASSSAISCCKKWVFPYLPSSASHKQPRQHDLSTIPVTKVPKRICLAQYPTLNPVLRSRVGFSVAALVAIAVAARLHGLDGIKDHQEQEYYPRKYLLDIWVLKGLDGR